MTSVLGLNSMANWAEPSRPTNNHEWLGAGGGGVGGIWGGLLKSFVNYISIFQRIECTTKM
jgi:hypothetical protein